MINGLKVLGLVPARGGSKGVKRKNLISLEGRTLVEWAIINLKECRYIDHIIVSTEDEEIIDTVQKLGDYISFERPKSLAEDNSKSLEVIKHAIMFENIRGRNYDLIALSEPSCPFRKPQHFTEALKMISNNYDISSVVSLVRVGDNHPIRMKKLLPDGKLLPYFENEPEGLRRQDQETLFIRNGGVYIFRSANIMDGILYGKNPYGFELNNKLYTVNIDEEVDVVIAKTMVDKLRLEQRLQEVLPI